jgi:hypothetical protein
MHFFFSWWGFYLWIKLKKTQQYSECICKQIRNTWNIWWLLKIITVRFKTHGNSKEWS